MSDTKIAAELRTEFGKGAARRLRRASQVPAVLYGHGTDPVHLSIPGHDTMMALKQGANVLITLEFDGKTELALPKHVQRDPLKGFIEHVDLLLVRRGEKVTVEIPVTVTGEAAPDTMVSLEQTTIAIEAEATHLPDGVEVSVEGLEEGSLIHAVDVKLPRGSTLIADEEMLIVNVTAVPTGDFEAEEAAEAGEVEEAVAEEPSGEESEES